MKLAVSIVFALALATPARAQRILDWPLRTTSAPEAVTRGVEAAFWNPAAITSGAGRGEAILIDQKTPDGIGLGGFAAAAAYRLDPRTTIAIGYQHVAIDDIQETSTSPVPDPGELPFSVAEDQFSFGASHVLSKGIIAGAGVRYERSNEWATVFPNDPAYTTTTALSAGFLFTPTLPLTPSLGVNVLTRTGGVRYTTGLELVAPPLADHLELRAGVGVRGTDDGIVEKRIGSTVSYRGFASVTAGLAGADAGSTTEWQPVYGASLRVSRYELGILRESLSNDFGAAWSLRFRFGLK